MAVDIPQTWLPGEFSEDSSDEIDIEKRMLLPKRVKSKSKRMLVPKRVKPKSKRMIIPKRVKKVPKKQAKE